LAARPELVAEGPAEPLAFDVVEPLAVPLGRGPPLKLALTPVLFLQWES
jgi:hypothetical protein